VNRGDGHYRLVWQPALAAVDRAAWDRLALTAAFPFLEWDWLELLESSGSITPARGWTPQHLTVWDGQRLVAAAPFYIKPDDQGEFVFDHPWAEAARRLGAPYYPKLVGAVPVTPLDGYRFLFDPDHDEERLTRVMVQGIRERCEALGLGGCHLHFVTSEARSALARCGFQAWHHHGFLWSNAPYADFEEFLDRFNRNQRRNIRRERERLSRSGIRVDIYRGEEIPEAFFHRMFRWYSHTHDRYGPRAARYLTEDFFVGLSRRWRHRLLFTAARRPEDPAATPLGMAMLVHKGKRLYGRYWGGDPRLPLVHFETCYYRPIQWAIAMGLDTFDPGMGGAHKLRRGFVSRSTPSLHRFTHPRLTALMAAHIEGLNRLQERHVEALNAAMPLRIPDRSSAGFTI
jgi:predicted N-acyltransferase